MKYRLKKNLDVTVSGRGIYKPSDLCQMVRRMRTEKPFKTLMGSICKGELLFGCYENRNGSEVFHVDSEKTLAEYERRFANGAFRARRFFAVWEKFCEPAEPTVEPDAAMLAGSEKPPVLARQGPYE